MMLSKSEFGLAVANNAEEATIRALGEDHLLHEFDNTHSAGDFVSIYLQMVLALIGPSSVIDDERKRTLEDLSDFADRRVLNVTLWSHIVKACFNDLRFIRQEASEVLQTMHELPIRYRTLAPDIEHAFRIEDDSGWLANGYSSPLLHLVAALAETGRVLPKMIRVLDPPTRSDESRFDGPEMVSRLERLKKQFKFRSSIKLVKETELKGLFESGEIDLVLSGFKSAGLDEVGNLQTVHADFQVRCISLAKSNPDWGIMTAELGPGSKFFPSNLFSRAMTIQETVLRPDLKVIESAVRLGPELVDLWLPLAGPLPHESIKRLYSRKLSPDLWRFLDFPQSWNDRRSGSIKEYMTEAKFHWSGDWMSGPTEIPLSDQAVDSRRDILIRLDFLLAATKERPLANEELTEIDGYIRDCAIAPPREGYEEPTAKLALKVLRSHMRNLLNFDRLPTANELLQMIDAGEFRDGNGELDDDVSMILAHLIASDQIADFKIEMVLDLPPPSYQDFWSIGAETA